MVNTMTAHATRNQHYFPIPTRSRQNPYSTPDHHVRTTTRSAEHQTAVNSSHRLPPINDLFGPAFGSVAPRSPELRQDRGLGRTYEPNPFIQGPRNQNEPQYRPTLHLGGPVQPHSVPPAPVEPRIDSTSTALTSLDRVGVRRSSWESEGPAFRTSSYRRTSEPGQHNIFEESQSLPSTPNSDEPGPFVRTPPSAWSSRQLNGDNSRSRPHHSSFNTPERARLENQPIDQRGDLERLRESTRYQVLQLHSNAEELQGRSRDIVDEPDRTHICHRIGDCQFSSARYDPPHPHPEYRSLDPRSPNTHLVFQSHHASSRPVMAMDPQQPPHFGGMGGLYQPSHHAASNFEHGYGGTHFDYPYHGRKKPKANHTKQQTDILVAWVDDHLDDPYPTDAQKQELSRDTGLDGNQISNWFINRRRRDPRIANAEKGRKRGSQHATEGPIEKNLRHDRKDRDGGHGGPPMGGAGMAV